MTNVTRSAVLAVALAVLAAGAGADASTVPAGPWWWTPAHAELSLTRDPVKSTGAACIGVGSPRYTGRNAASVSPNGELGAGQNLSALETRVPKYRRFRCLFTAPGASGKQRWLVADLVPRGPYASQRSLVRVAPPQTIALR